MPVASECVRRACVESPRSIMWGWCGRMTAIGPWGPAEQQQLRGMAAGIYCLTRDLGCVRHTTLRLIILLVCVRHLMLFGPKNAGGWMSWPNNDCSFDDRSS